MPALTNASGPPTLFNRTSTCCLLPVACRCKEAGPLARNFWVKMSKREIKPISSKDVKGSQMDEEQADEWFTQHKMS